MTEKLATTAGLGGQVVLLEASVLGGHISSKRQRVILQLEGYQGLRETMAMLQVWSIPNITSSLASVEWAVKGQQWEHGAVVSSTFRSHWQTCQQPK